MSSRARICGHCGVNSYFRPIGDPLHVSLSKSPGVTTHVLNQAHQCITCNRLSLAEWKAADRNVGIFMPTLSNAQSVKWTPQHAISKEYVSVPPEISAAASEAWASYSYGAFRGAMAIARAVVEATAKERNATGNTLYARIEKLKDEQIIRAVIADAAHEIRFFGNDIAHGDFAEEIDEGDVLQALELMDLVLSEVYESVAKIASVREKRLAAKAAETELIL